MDMRMFQNKPVSLLGYGCMRFPTQEKDGKRTNPAGRRRKNCWTAPTPAA